jgi:hypothetical protein
MRWKPDVIGHFATSFGAIEDNSSSDAGGEAQAPLSVAASDNIFLSSSC